MTDLFQIPESKSPRLRWIEKHAIQMHCSNDSAIPWMAWLPNNSDGGLPIDTKECGFGCLQDDALIDLARKHGLKSWKEEG
jgi:hypothetical protein